MEPQSHLRRIRTGPGDVCSRCMRVARTPLLRPIMIDPAVTGALCATALVGTLVEDPDTAGVFSPLDALGVLLIAG